MPAINAAHVGQDRRVDEQVVPHREKRRDRAAQLARGPCCRVRTPLEELD
jgi:hypothetical protein